MDLWEDGKPITRTHSFPRVSIAAACLSSVPVLKSSQRILTVFEIFGKLRIVQGCSGSIQAPVQVSVQDCGIAASRSPSLIVNLSPSK